MRSSELRAELRRGEAIVAGVLSGTSGDGIDVAIARIGVAQDDDGGERLLRPECLAFATEPFPEDSSARVRAALDDPTILGPRALAVLDRDLGLAFGAAAVRVAERAGLELRLVGSHGQTIFHHDGDPSVGPATMQLGDGCWVAEAAGCSVVSDFRQRDLAAGGEGAPIACLVDAALFPDRSGPTAVLNLGGMANLSLLGVEGLLSAFDVGPAGSLLDGLARDLLGLPFDRDGRAAADGRVDPELLAIVESDSRWTALVRRAPPKSTGRDTFGAAWLRDLRARAGSGFSASTWLATACEAVARAVARALESERADWAEVLVAGGGVHNKSLMEALRRWTSAPVRSTAERGVDPDAREALAFAALAAACFLELPLSDPRATGAAPGRVLGKVSFSARCALPGLHPGLHPASPGPGP